MKCGDRAMLSTFLDGECDEETRLWFQGHMAGCAPCQALAEQLELRSDRLRARLAALDPKEIREMSALAVIELHARHVWPNPLRRSLASLWKPVSVFRLAAALLVAVTALIVLKGNPAVDLAESAALEQDWLCDDPNRSWNDRQLVVTLEGEDGRLTEIIVTSRDERSIRRVSLGN